MQVVAILVSLVVSGALVAATALTLRGRRRRAVRPAVPGGTRRDFFGDAAAPASPSLVVAPEPAANGPLTPLRRAA